MDIRSAVSEFVSRGKELLDRLHSDEHKMLTGVDLHILRVQLHLLDNEAATIQNLQYARSKGITQE
ncbi:MAG TPA: hypothetical protein VIU63_10610 [Nitrospira sp.]